jgi:ssDNA-binding Zn-finger/Zn-ribbon topoisomerase 1
MRDCTNQKGYQGCYACSDFPCTHIGQFPVSTGKKVMLRAHPAIQKLGPAAFAEAEEQRYRCPTCGQLLHRGARVCQYCQSLVDLD